MRQGLKRAPFALILSAALASTFAGASRAAWAQDDADGGAPPASYAAAPAVARIAAVQGQVGIKQGDGGETTDAAMNAPLIAGDYLTTGPQSRAEVQLDANTIVRAGSDTQMRFTQVDGQADVAQLAEGSMELRVLQQDPDQVQVQTPSADIEPAEPGAYLITVTHGGITQVTARSGSLSVVTPQGTQEVDPGRTMEIAGNASNPEYHYVDEVALTNLEAWGDQRDQQMLAQADQAPPEDQGDQAYAIAGMSDLSQDGNWVNIPDYGEAWVPNGVSPSWTPYSDGQWAYEPYYGYTWVSAEPWGWAPYHYGRWAYADPYGWAWVPGPAYVRPVWAPALVAFFRFGGVGVGVGFGNVGWVALAPGEPYRPWYGGSRLSFNVAFNDYRNYAHGFVGVSYNTWQRGVVRNVRPLSGAYLANAHFYGGTVNGRVTDRTLAASSNAWQHFGGSYNRGYQPSYARSYQSSYARGYQPSYARGYQSSYARGYQPSYARGYQSSYARGYQPSYARGYQSTYNRGYQSTYGRGYRQTYGRGYQQTYNRGYSYAPRQSYQRQSSTRGAASGRYNGGGRGRSHGPGRS